MKKTTMCALRWRDALARKSGRIRSTEAPVVPIRLAIRPPKAIRPVLSSGVPESEPPT